MEKRVEPLSKMRRIISQRMCESLTQTAQFTLTREMDVDAVLDYIRKRKEAGRPVKFMHVLMKATASVLMEHPRLNASIKDDTLVYHDGVNMGVAVALEDGLLVPVVPDVDAKSLEEIAAAYEELVPRARIGRLRGTEMSGGTFTISNLGMIGIDAFTPIVNYPESAILGVGRTNERVYLDEGAVKTKKTIVFSLSMDHRLVDGYVGAQFLDALAQTLASGDALRAAVEGV